MQRIEKNLAVNRPPRMVAALVPREILSWALTAIPLGALEGGLLGVIVKNQFNGIAAPVVVNLSVAIVAGAPSFANLSSFFFANLASGRDKIRLLSRLMYLMTAALLLMALPGASPLGLVVFLLGTVAARVAWSGVLTIRAAVWRANFSRRWRGHVTARIVQLASLLVAACSTLIGYLMDWNGAAYRLVFPLVGLGSLAGAIVYRRTTMRRHRRLIRSEVAERGESKAAIGLKASIEVLRENREFRDYMIGMMVFGSGNLMIIALLVVLINEHFNLSRVEQVMITSSVPLLCLCFSISYWARLLADRHIFGYRAIHSWIFVSSYLVFALAMLLHWPGLLWLGSALLGTALAGGHLGWNLGHNDFSSDANSTLYMAIHVGLTGLRGLLMPLAGVVFYEFLESLGSGTGVYAMLLPLFLSALGAAWFVWLHFERERRIGLG